MIDPAPAEAFVDTGPEFVEWVERATPLRYHLVPGLPDHHPEHPGGKPGGGRSLDPALFWFGELGGWADRVVPAQRTPRLTLTETPPGGGTGAAAHPTLLRGPDGITGVRFADGGEVTARAVVIASGGFEWDRELVTAFLRGPMTSPASVPTNTGDGLRMAMAAAAFIDWPMSATKIRKTELRRRLVEERSPAS